MKRILFYLMCIYLIPAAFADVNTPDVNAQLLQAAKDGNLPAVKTALSQGADVNAKRSTDGVTALIWAALNGDTEIVKLLLENGADFNAKSNDGLAALGAAKSQGHKDIVQMLDKTAAPAGLAEKNEPEKKAQLNQATKDSNLPAVQTESKEDKFPLNNAANQGDIEKVKELIAKGYDINDRDDANWTPLHRAIFMCHKEIAKLLVANGADVNAKNNIGGIPIMLAVIHDYNDIIELLIAKGAERTIYVAAAQGDIEKVKTLLKKDPNLINATASNDGWSALHWAAYMGHLDTIKFLIENRANINIRDSRGGDTTPLFWAAYKGRLEAAKLLIEKGADVNIRIKDGRTILHCPGTFETAKLLIDNKADVNAKDDNGTTPLNSIAGKDSLNVTQRVLIDKNGWTSSTWKTDFEKQRDAAEKVTAQIAELLIKSGADVNAQDIKGNTPLSNAKTTNNKALIELLEKYNATAPSVQTAPAKGDDVNIEIFALHKAAYEGNLEEVKALIAKGADVNTRWPKDINTTPLHFAASKGYEDMQHLFIFAGAKTLNEIKDITKKTDYPRAYTEIVSLLLAKDADVNAKTGQGWTALHFAAVSGHLDMAQMLVAKGAGINTKDVHDVTPLWLAAANNHKDIENFLIAKGAKVDISIASAMGDIERVKAFLKSSPSSINETRGGDNTPLHDAAWSGRTEMANFLIEKGANVNAGYPEKPTPLSSAASKGHLDCVKLLVANGAHVNTEKYRPLANAVVGGNREIVEFFIANDADVNAKGPEGFTPLFLASENGSKDIAELLIAKGADVNIKANDGRNALYLPALKGHIEIVKLLLDKGIDINTKQDSDGATPLMATSTGRTDSVKLLLEKNADVNVKRTTDSATALILAAREGCTENVKLLLEKGADVTAKNNDGKTALDMAKENGHAEVVQLLEKAGAKE